MLFVAFFVCLNNLVFHVRVPVGVFYLNMSKRGKKQDENDDSFESYICEGLPGNDLTGCQNHKEQSSKIQRRLEILCTKTRKNYRVA